MMTSRFGNPTGATQRGQQLAGHAKLLLGFCGTHRFTFGREAAGSLPMCPPDSPNLSQAKQPKTQVQTAKTHAPGRLP